MGLLTDPSAGQGRLTKALVKYHSKLCILLYISGVIWFAFLPSEFLNADTYFSENALLPGLVQPKFTDGASARQFYNELQDEMKKYDDSIPYPWLLAKMSQIGLDTYTHNFTLNYPLTKTRKQYTGKNVYGILRAPRAASTEALVMSVPYRPPSSMHLTTAPSIAVMLAFAKFANKATYWAKDIIFLITEHEQLGMQAWLEAYHDVVCGQPDILKHGDLRGRGGAIQAAINLEFHDINIGPIDIKIEGLNGQLPNLDLINLAGRLIPKGQIYHTFKNRISRNLKKKFFMNWKYNFKTLMSMVFSQATGIPNGNHGLYHRFGIQALTLEGFPGQRIHADEENFKDMGQIVEGIFRSLNNLLERFHQSYFFYLLSSTDKFISIGLYMPAVCLIAGALFVKACGKWCQLQQNPLSTKGSKGDNDTSENSQGDNIDNSQGDNIENSQGDNIETVENEIEGKEINLVQIGSLLLLTHIIGVTIMKSPSNITSLGSQYGFTTELSIYGAFILISLCLLITPFFVTIRTCYKSMAVLNILALLELATALICLSMYNFSLGFLAGMLYAPLVLLINPSNCRACSFIQKLLWLIAHPLIVITATVLVFTFISFSGEPFLENVIRGILATQQAIVFGIVDSMIYSNWLYSVITCIMIPNWLCFWLVLFSVPKPKIEEVDAEKKND